MDHICKWKNCFKKFDSSLDLKTHVEQAHLGKRKNKYKCEWQDCKFGERKKIYDLKTHVTIHHKHLSHYCVKCNKGFLRDQELRKHKRVGCPRDEDLSEQVTRELNEMSNSNSNCNSPTHHHHDSSTEVMDHSTTDTSPVSSPISSPPSPSLEQHLSSETSSYNCSVPASPVSSPSSPSPYDALFNQYESNTPSYDSYDVFLEDSNSEDLEFLTSKVEEISSCAVGIELQIASKLEKSIVEVSKQDEEFLSKFLVK